MPKECPEGKTPHYEILRRRHPLQGTRDASKFANMLHSITCCYDAYVLVYTEFEQMPVSRYDKICLGGQCASEDVIIIGIIRDDRNDTDRVDNSSQFRVSQNKIIQSHSACGDDFVEFFTDQYPGQLRQQNAAGTELNSDLLRGFKQSCRRALPQQSRDDDIWYRVPAASGLVSAIPLFTLSINFGLNFLHGHRRNASSGNAFTCFHKFCNSALPDRFTQKRLNGLWFQ